MLVDLIKQGNIFDMINFSDHSILSHLTEDEGGPYLVDMGDKTEECFSLFILPNQYATEVVLTKSELLLMLEAIENKL